MMESIFLTVIRMSLTASIAAVFVILLRQLAGKKLPRTFCYAAWAIVLIRLLIPVSIQSDLSLFNIVKAPVTALERVTGTEMLRDGAAFQNAGDAKEHITGNNKGIVNSTELSSADHVYIKNSGTKGKPEVKGLTDKVSLSGKSRSVFVMACIWLSGFIAFFAFGIYAYIKIMCSFRTAVLYNDKGLLEEAAGKLKLRRKVKIYISDKTDSPLVTGLANARIIIPPYLAYESCKRELEYVIIHELVHIKRFDNITRLLAVLALCIHWFNPLVWICFFLYQKDMEISCDARVLSAYENDIRTEYANSLLNIAVKQNTLVYGLVIAFGESNIKGRIRGILSFKRNKVWLGILAVLLLVVSAFLLLTNGKNEGKNNIYAKNKLIKINDNTLNMLLKHRSRYIGNASNASNLLDKLPYGRMKEGIELDTAQKPYGITVNYRLKDIDTANQDTDTLIKNNVKPVLLDNALILFSLIENVDIVKFKILPADLVVQYERSQLQQYFDREFWEYSASKEDFERFLLDIYFEIFIFPEKYSLAMSSVPGIQIMIALNAEYYDAAYSIKYTTENGSLLTRNISTGQITDHGKSLDLSLVSFDMETHGLVYWSPHDMDEAARENTVTISILNKKGDIIISKPVRIETEDGQSFKVKPSYDISYDDDFQE